MRGATTEKRGWLKPLEAMKVIMEKPHLLSQKGAHGSIVVKALCCKQEGHGFEIKIFINLLNPSGCTRPWGLLSL
jgi:hypothetical protein